MDHSIFFQNAYHGSLRADALAMPVHWYYNTNALDSDYGSINEFKAPKNPHPDSILWRSHYTAPNQLGDILHDQAQFWGVREVHYHQNLKKGENTLNYKLAQELFELVNSLGRYDSEKWLEHYVEFMLNPSKQNDTYVEEYHRRFFTRHANGVKLLKCGVRDEHIGGLAQVPALIAALAMQAEEKGKPMQRDAVRSVVKAHVALTHRHSNVIRAADCLCRLLWSLSEGNTLKCAIQKEAGDWLSCNKATKWMNQADRVIVGQKISPACYIDQAFPAALYLALKYDQQYELGIQANAEVGGDNCHRGAVVGALLANSYCK